MPPFCSLLPIHRCRPPAPLRTYPSTTLRRVTALPGALRGIAGSYRSGTRTAREAGVYKATEQKSGVKVQVGTTPKIHFTQKRNAVPFLGDERGPSDEHEFAILPLLRVGDPKGSSTKYLNRFVAHLFFAICGRHLLSSSHHACNSSPLLSSARGQVHLSKALLPANLRELDVSCGTLILPTPHHSACLHPRPPTYCKAVAPLPPSLMQFASSA